MIDYTRSKKENGLAWFTVVSPFEGKVITSLKYNKALDQYYVEAGELSQDEALEDAKTHEDNQTNQK